MVRPEDFEFTTPYSGLPSGEAYGCVSGWALDFDTTLLNDSCDSGYLRLTLLRILIGEMG